MKKRRNKGTLRPEEQPDLDAFAEDAASSSNPGPSEGDKPRGGERGQSRAAKKRAKKRARTSHPDAAAAPSAEDGAASSGKGGGDDQADLMGAVRRFRETEKSKKSGKS